MVGYAGEAQTPAVVVAIEDVLWSMHWGRLHVEVAPAFSSVADPKSRHSSRLHLLLSPFLAILLPSSYHHHNHGRFNSHGTHQPGQDASHRLRWTTQPN
jgi:hypothetical protein